MTATQPFMPGKEAWRRALILFAVARVALTIWAVLILSILPLPDDVDKVLRPYVGAPILDEGLAGALLGPWQRFDAMRYLALARDGYDAQHSVFPPLYPLAIRGLGAPVAAVTGWPVDTANLVAAILISNLALIGALAFLHKLLTMEGAADDLPRTLVYLLVFPTGFFLLAPYSESLFLLFTLAAFVAIRQERPLLAGALGACAALTRLTGWSLVIPLAYFYLRQHGWAWRRLSWRGVGVLLPGIALALFFGWRAAAGLPPLGAVYQSHWYQSTRLPGSDVWRAAQSLLTGRGPRAGELSLILDAVCLGLLLATTAIIFRRHRGYGLYNLIMLLFMLLPTSDVKPLYSFSRYALAFFPTFMLLGRWGRNPWLNRLILYLSLLLYLFFSAQFFIWGWVA